MKLFVVCLAAACLFFVAISANVVVSSSSSSANEDNDSPTDYEYIAHDLAEDITDVDLFISWSGIYFVIQKALQFIKGVKCTVVEVYEIKDASVTFLTDIKQCGCELNSKILKLVTTCQNIVNIAGSIIGVNESICGNSNGNELEVSNPEGAIVETIDLTTPIKCFVNLFAKTIKLKNEVLLAIRMIKQIPKVPGETEQCVNTAIQNLANVFNEFPENVKYCSGLSKY